jgi:hypothetical protein
MLVTKYSSRKARNGMNAPNEILQVWNQFKHFPMETLTKAWYASQNPTKYQRSVAQMKAHYDKYKITGNCFDLAIWLLHELKEYGIQAYAIGHDLFTEEAHVAVIALDEHNHKYLCDLGDQWVQPICVDSNNSAFHSKDCVGFFPGATIQVHPSEEDVEIFYKRPNGKVSKQVFNLQPIDESTLLEAAEFSQRHIRPRPLLECRQYEQEVTHWEFYNWHSFTSTMDGLIEDEDLESIHEWAARIHKKTGYHVEFLIEALTLYRSEEV